MKRRYPSDLELKMSADEVDLNSFRKFFSDEWLSKGLDTPVHDLWRDQSNCASVELYLYDQCLRALEPIQKAWVDEKRNSIINHPDQRHVGGALAEVIFAGAFKLGGYQVELASKSQPVYDFSIESKSNVTPYISCKYVGAKNTEISFLEHMNTFELQLKEIVKASHPINLLLQIFDRDVTAKLTELMPNLKQVYESYISEPAAKFGMLGDKDKRFVMFLNELSALDENVVFSSKVQSYTLIAAHQIHLNEQIKFNDIVQKANSDYLKLGIKTRDERFNFLTTLICPTLDFSKATEWVQEQFNNGLLPNLDAVLIVRVQPTQDINPDGSFSNIATTEYHLAVNQQRHSADSIRSIFGVHGIAPTIPVGKTSNQPTKFQIQVGDNQSIDLGGHYVYASGEHYYHKSGFGEVSMTTYPNIRVHTDWELDGKRMLLTPKDQNRSNFILI